MIHVIGRRPIPWSAAHASCPPFCTHTTLEGAPQTSFLTLLENSYINSAHLKVLTGHAKASVCVAVTTEHVGGREDFRLFSKEFFISLLGVVATS